MIEIEKHTPGPWLYSPERDTHDFCIHTLDPKMSGPHIHQDSGIVGSSEWTWINDADGYLIAAAPELLKALKYARRFLNPEDHDVAYIDAVIDNATGHTAWLAKLESKEHDG